MTRTKLGRNLKRGDLIRLHDDTGLGRKTATCEVAADAVETRPGRFSGKRRWTVRYRVLTVSHGQWFGTHTDCYSDTRYDLVNR